MVKIPGGPLIGLSSSACMRSIDSKEGGADLAQRIVTVISGQQKPGIDTDNTQKQKTTWEYLVQERKACRPRYVLESANQQLNANFNLQKKASIAKLGDDFWNNKTRKNIFQNGCLGFKDGNRTFDDPIIFTTEKDYEDFWMENGVWYGQLQNGLAVDITTEVRPQIERFIEIYTHLFPNPKLSDKIPTKTGNIHSPFYHKPGRIWVSPEEFGITFNGQTADIQAALRYEMLRGTDAMKKIARQLEQPTQKEEDIAAIIRGVRAFKPINEGSETETPEEFKPRQLVYLL